MKIMVVSRILSNENLTLSECYIRDKDTGIILFDFYGIELPWKNNERMISCIPANKYYAVAIKRWSNGKYALWVQDVPDRSEILVHQANYPTDVLGCLGPGRGILRRNSIHPLSKVYIDDPSRHDEVIGVGPSAPVIDYIQMYIPIGEVIEYHVIDTYRRIGNLDPKDKKTV